ncbi:FAD-dependent monooxygenase [Agromyces sp. NPDC049794]|uniref:FAD-dependent monooxygenase n=1 Tax=unclassified Agromyces TaxID=2639701 RepID=UPI0033F96E37
MAEVIVVGSGPSGMMLAGELALAGVDVQIMERRPTREVAGSRAGGFHSRTIELLDQRGIADRFLAEGQTAQTARFGRSLLDISDFPTRHPYGLGLWQNRMEPILAGWIEELGVPVHRGREVTGFVQDESGVDVELADGETVRATYLVGADGGRSVIRKVAGIEFPGWDATRSNLIAEVEAAREPPQGTRFDESGVHGFTLMADGRTYRVITTEQQLGAAVEPSLVDLSEALEAVYGTDFGVHDPTWISRFTDATRQAATYRRGRVLLVGDAAHIHYPAGGQGIGLGLQDAVNLGWKLAQVVDGISPESLLDTYHAERHPAGARALTHSMAQTALQRLDPRTAALAETVGELMLMDQPRSHIAALIHGLDIAYDLGEGHPLLGRRMPDLDLDTAAGPIRVFTLLHDAKPVLLNLAEPTGIDITPWAERVQLVDARFTGAWRLPIIGEVSPPTAVLIRPDGHVAWVGQGADEGLTDALTRWFGPGLPAR